jgi:hypothetical protein
MATQSVYMVNVIRDMTKVSLDHIHTFIHILGVLHRVLSYLYHAVRDFTFGHLPCHG